MNYDELSNLKPMAYLNPKNFKTNWEKVETPDSIEHAKSQYEKGLSIGREYKEIMINDRSVWSAGLSSDCAAICSSEGIGYHRNTASLLQGFIDSGAKITVSRFINDTLTKTVIQESSINLENNPQQEIVDKIKKDYPEKTVIKLLDLNKYNPLSSQVSAILNDNSLISDVFDKNSYFKGDYIFVISNNDIAKRLLMKEILNVKGVNHNAMLIEKKDISEIDYLFRDRVAGSFEFNNKNVDVFITKHPSNTDKQEVCFIVKDIENIKTKNKIKNSI